MLPTTDLQQTFPTPIWGNSTKLPEYPQAIARAAEKHLQASQEVEIQSELLDFLTGEIEAAIADNPNLKNEQQRKAKRLALTQEPDYLAAKIALKQALFKRERLQIRLNLLRNQFAVAKLEARLQIAQLEAVA